jgi:hypothetical protein
VKTWGNLRTAVSTPETPLHGPVREQGILYTVLHNLAAAGFVRVDNWQQVADYFATVKD